MRRKSEAPASTANPAPAADFRTLLKNQSVPAAAAAAAPPGTIGTVTPPSPAAVAAPPGTIGTVTPPSPAAAAAPPGTIGTVTPPSPAAVTTTPAATVSPMAPTAQSLFGANPWITNAGGSGPNGSYAYNPLCFATPATAARVAQMLGGRVVEMDAITSFGPFKQNQPNRMVQMPDGRLINAGIVAGFYDHGYTQQMVDKMIAAEVSGDLLYS
jgi:hypothetical protein